MEQKSSYYKKRQTARFEEFGQKIVNGQDALKNHILNSYPIIRVKNTDDYSIAGQYKDKSDYVWLVSTDIEVSKLFTFWWKPPKDSVNTVYQFPYIYKRSKRVKDWTMVQLVPTEFNNLKTSHQRSICGTYDPYRGKDLYDLFFLQEKSNLINWFKFSKMHPRAVLVSSIQEALDTSTTDMLWIVPDDIEVLDTFKFDFEPDEWSYPLAHVFYNGLEDNYNGIALLPKTYNVSNRETMYRFYANRKIVEIPASKPEPYDVFYIDSHSTYLDAMSSTTTNMFWVVPKGINVDSEFAFDYYVPKWDEKYTHVFLNGSVYDGVMLIPSNIIIPEEEFNRRSFEQKKIPIQASIPGQYDIVFVDFGNREAKSRFDQLVEKHPKAKYFKLSDTASNICEELITVSRTDIVWIVPSDVVVDDDFSFDYQVPKWDDRYIHTFLNGKNHDGIYLLSLDYNISEKEFLNRFYINKKEISVKASNHCPYDIVFVDQGEPYADAQYQHLLSRFPNALRVSNIQNVKDLYACVTQSVLTSMFWMVPSDVNIADDFLFDYQVPKWDERYTHTFLNGSSYDGIALMSSSFIVIESEFKERIYIQKKEIPITASLPRQYDIVFFDYGEPDAELLYAKLKERIPTAKQVSNVTDISDIYSNVDSNVFWLVPSDVVVDDDFSFDYQVPKWDEKYVHTFLNGNYYDGILLLSKSYPVSDREFSKRYFINKKAIEHKASIPLNKPYDIVFISYKEINADENYNRLLSRFPGAKRVHGVKGIHQAHIEAAKQVNTEMFWVVDADAIISDNFKFDWVVPYYEKDVVHVWWSKNPINSLIYGYGGVKLLPTQLTLEMDTTTSDMTTSISTKFKSIPIVSNITAFNTDEFSAWKSAFRECAKLSSGIIARQNQEETLERLAVWTTQESNEAFSEHAYQGALAGKEFGEKNRNNPDELKKINDFEWLKDCFNNL